MITDPPPTSFTPLSNWKNQPIQQNCRNSWTNYVILMSFEILIVILSTLWLKALFLTIGAWWCHKDIFTNHQLINQSFNDEPVYRTAPATPGLLIICLKTFQVLDNYLLSMCKLNAAYVPRMCQVCANHVPSMCQVCAKYMPIMCRVCAKEVPTAKFQHPRSINQIFFGGKTKLCLYFFQNVTWFALCICSKGKQILLSLAQGKPYHRRPQIWVKRHYQF